MMRRFFIVSLLLSTFVGCAGMNLADLTNASQLTESEAASGLKEALIQGATEGATQASATDGFF